MNKFKRGLKSTFFYNCLKQDPALIEERRQDLGVIHSELEDKILHKFCEKGYENPYYLDEIMEDFNLSKEEAQKICKHLMKDCFIMDELTKITEDSFVFVRGK